MDKKLLVTLLGIVTLAVLAIIGKSTVMFVSAGAVGIAAYVFRRARMRDRLIGIIAAALGGSIGAEIVRTLYYYSGPAGAGGRGGETGGEFMTAIVIGVINAAAIIVVILCTEAAFRIIGRKSEQQGVEQ